MNLFRIMMTAAVAAGVSTARAESPAGNHLVIHADQGKDTINRNIYGHFVEHIGRSIYDGLWVGPDSPIPNTRGIRNDAVTALRRIKVPVLRWPGGCFADEYHWQDGIGPREARPSMVNTNWGGTENNHFGTHEFLDLCEQLGCDPYITGNVGSGTVREMQQWVEYVTFDGSSPMANLRKANGQEKPWKLPFFGIGNENWGCGGQMTAEYYADQYRRFSTFVRNLGDNKVFKIACGPNRDDYHWTEVMMQRCGGQMDGLALHAYCYAGRKTRSATRFDEADWFELLKQALVMEEFVTKHAAIMDKHDPQKRVALVVDEWGAWHEAEPGGNLGLYFQQNSLRDALVAGATLNLFNRHCDRVRMANIAQMINILQSVILTDKEKMLLTPTYHVFEMYTVHHDATMLPIETKCADYRFENESIPGVSASASRDKAGRIHVTLCNLNPNQPAKTLCELGNQKLRKVTGRVLTAPTMTAHNTFDQPDQVKPAAFNAHQLTAAGINVTLPAMSVVVLEVE